MHVPFTQRFVKISIFKILKNKNGILFIFRQILRIFIGLSKNEYRVYFNQEKLSNISQNRVNISMANTFKFFEGHLIAQ